MYEEKESREFEVKAELQEKRKDIKSFDNLTAFLEDVSKNYGTGYGECVRAIGQAILATADYLGHEFGITGFQAGCIMWEFISEWTDFGDEVGAKILDYDKMLYPQYEHDFQKVISSKTWENLQKAAKARLDCDTEGACGNVIDHWRSIIDGKVPFGYVVKDD